MTVPSGRSAFAPTWNSHCVLTGVLRPFLPLDTVPPKAVWISALLSTLHGFVVAAPPGAANRPTITVVRATAPATAPAAVPARLPVSLLMSLVLLCTARPLPGANLDRTRKEPDRTARLLSAPPALGGDAPSRLVAGRAGGCRTVARLTVDARRRASSDGGSGEYPMYAYSGWYAGAPCSWMSRPSSSPGLGDPQHADAP